MSDESLAPLLLFMLVLASLGILGIIIIGGAYNKDIRDIEDEYAMMQNMSIEESAMTYLVNDSYYGVNAVPGTTGCVDTVTAERYGYTRAAGWENQTYCEARFTYRDIDGRNRTADVIMYKYKFAPKVFGKTYDSLRTPA